MNSPDSHSLGKKDVLGRCFPTSSGQNAAGKRDLCTPLTTVHWRRTTCFVESECICIPWDTSRAGMKQTNSIHLMGFRQNLTVTLSLLADSHPLRLAQVRGGRANGNVADWLGIRISHSFHILLLVPCLTVHFLDTHLGSLIIARSQQTRHGSNRLGRHLPYAWLPMNLQLNSKAST